MNGWPLHGYKNIQGTFVIKPVYKVAEPFREGLALVGKANEFGEVKYGFINKKGEVVIPFRYTNKPSHFSSGLSKVTPVDKSEYEHAFINRKGEIVIKVMQDMIKKYGPIEVFDKGYSLYALGTSPESNKYVMDTTGKIHTMTSFLKQFGITDQGLYIDGLQDYAPKLIAITNGPGMNTQGWINLENKTFVKPVFRDVTKSVFKNYIWRIK